MGLRKAVRSWRRNRVGGGEKGEVAEREDEKERGIKKKSSFLSGGFFSE
jgi:hypothetical protein